MELFRGRLARKPFALGVLAVYLAGIAAQALLSGEVVARAGLWPFILAQAALIFLWLVLHVRRLRDAGQGPAAAIGVAFIYALAVALLLMLVAFLTNPDMRPAFADGDPPTPGHLFGFLVIIAVLGLLFTPDFGTFMMILKLLVLLSCLPALISLIFSIRTGMRPGA